jgi:hypothetical protein
MLPLAWRLSLANAESGSQVVNALQEAKTIAYPLPNAATDYTG